MNYVLVFRLEARNELDDAYSWYESQQLSLGDDFLEQVEETLARICQLPESYPAVYRDVRRLPPVACAKGRLTPTPTIVRRFPYTIYYRIVSSRVTVTAVFHGRRDPKTWQART